MLFGQNPPDITYLGLNSGQKDPCVNTHLDLINIVLNSAKMNLELDIKNVCIDISELNLYPSFFECQIDQEADEILKISDEVERIIINNRIRIVFYIGRGYFLGSQLPNIVEETSKLLNQLSLILDILQVDYPSIFVRIGSAYGNRKSTMNIFCDRVKKLNENTVSKICVVNDDRPSLFSVTDLLTGVYYKIGIPISFRFLPHQFNDGGLSIREALFLSCSTWERNKKPLIFYSESKNCDSNGIPETPHPSEYLTRRIPTFGLDIDVVVDSPAREDVCLKYRMDYKSLPPVVINRVN